MEYLHWKEEKISDFGEANVSKLYGQGFVFTRIGRGIMHQTRSLRIDLNNFELSSENRRILKKAPGIEIKAIDLPYSGYHWSLAKMAKDFYDEKFGKNIFSAAKIKNLITAPDGNFNLLLNYSDIGFAISYINKDILHYSYPFYDLNKSGKDMGLAMMVKTICWAKEKGLEYIYLGSLQRPGDIYKLQFEGLEWFDGKKWSNDLEEAKKIIQKK